MVGRRARARCLWKEGSDTGLIPAAVVFTTGANRIADLNADLAAIRDTFNASAVLTDTNRTVGAVVTFTQTPLITLGSLTADQPLTLSETWNAAGVTFTALKVDVTDTASAAASLLLDLKVGGASKFSVSKAGDVTVGGNVVVTGTIASATKVARVLYQTRNVATSSISEVSLASYTLPAGTLASDGTQLRITAFWRATGTGTATPNIKVGTVAGIGLGTAYTASLNAAQRFIVTRASNTTFDSGGTEGGDNLTSRVAVTLATGGVTFSAANTIDFRGSVSAGTAVLTLVSATVELLSA
jgi:hypothetical protein